MLESLNNVKNVFKLKEIRQKLLYTLLMMIVIRIGSQLPAPGVDRTYFSNWFAAQTGDAFSFVDAFTGGSFLNMSILALNITPYITSSIIIQLLTIAIPKLEEMQREGEEGRKLLVSITRYVTVALALMEGAAMAIGFGRQGLLEEYNAINIIMVICTLTAGSAFLMWVGENITEKGVGNGISIILLINIVARIPNDFASLFEQFVKNASSVGGSLLAAVIIVGVVVVIVGFVVFLQDGERRISVQYSKKMQGRKLVGGASTHIPLKVNTAGVIPIIFAQSLFSFPIVICQLVSGKTPKWTYFLESSRWWNFSKPIYSIGYLVYVVLVIAFAYFYTSITFNPIEVADNMKKQGGFIPGIRPGKPTQDYLNNILNYIVFIGAIGLLIVATIPIAFAGIAGAKVSFGGTSLIIIVGVVLETLKSIESKMVVRNYKGFLLD